MIDRSLHRTLLHELESGNPDGFCEIFYDFYLNYALECHFTEEDNEKLTRYLYIAASHGYLGAVDRLLQVGVDPNRRHKNGFTPFEKSIGNTETHLKIFEMMMDAGADPNQNTRNGVPPLILAARFGSLEIVEKLLEEGADPNARDELNDMTALVMAASHGHDQIVSKLLDYGASPYLKAGNYTAYSKAALYGFSHVTDLLPEDSYWVGTEEEENSAIIELLREFGYGDSTSYKGVCYGIARMTIQAILAGNYNELELRMSIITTQHRDKLLSQINKALEKRLRLSKQIKINLARLPENIIDEKINDLFIDDNVSDETKDKIQEFYSTIAPGLSPKARLEKKKQLLLDVMVESCLDKRDKILIDIPSFLEGIDIHQRNMPELRQKDVKYQSSIPITLPKKLELHGIARADHFSGAYNQNIEELTVFFGLLEQQLLKDNFTIPFALTFSANKHIITVRYDAENQCWDFINHDIVMKLTDSEIGQAVASSFSSNGITAFHTEVHAQRNHLAEVRQFISRWRMTPEMQTLHTPTPERANLKSSSNQNWRFFASVYEGNPVLTKVLQTQESIFTRYKSTLGVQTLALFALGATSIGLGFALSGVTMGLSLPILGSLGASIITFACIAYPIEAKIFDRHSVKTAENTRKHNEEAEKEEARAFRARLEETKKAKYINSLKAKAREKKSAHDEETAHEKLHHRHKAPASHGKKKLIASHTRMFKHGNRDREQHREEERNAKRAARTI